MAKQEMPNPISSWVLSKCCIFAVHVCYLIVHAPEVNHLHPECCHCQAARQPLRSHWPLQQRLSLPTELSPSRDVTLWEDEVRRPSLASDLGQDSRVVDTMMNVEFQVTNDE